MLWQQAPVKVNLSYHYAPTSRWANAQTSNASSCMDLFATCARALAFTLMTRNSRSSTSRSVILSDDHFLVCTMFDLQECLKQHELAMEQAFAEAKGAGKCCGICMENIMEKVLLV